MTTQAKECPSPFSIYFTTQFYYNYYFLELVITWYVCAYTHAHTHINFPHYMKASCLPCSLERKAPERQGFCVPHSADQTVVTIPST